MVRLLLLLSTVGIVNAQTPAVSSVVNAASFQGGPIAPGELLAIFGSNLADSPFTCPLVAGALPTTCSGVSVLINGKSAPLHVVSPTQVQVQAPSDLTGSSATLQLSRQASGQTLQSPVINLSVAPSAPGLFTTNSTPNGIGTFLAAAGTPVDAAHPARTGDVVIGYGTGFGVTNPPVPAGTVAAFPALFASAVSITVGGQSAQVLFAGLPPGEAFLGQFNFIVPANLSTGNQPVVVSVGGATSPAVQLPVAIVKPAITAVTNNASGGNAISSGSWISIYGSALSRSTRIWRTSDFVGNNLPTSLDGVSVKINGKAAAVYYVSPNQLNVEAPSDTATGPVTVEVTAPTGIATFTAAMQTYAPGFYTFDDQYIRAVHTDGIFVAPVAYFGADFPSRPAQPGETILLFGTGFGPTAPPTQAGVIVTGAPPIADLTQLHILIGGVPAVVQFAGLVYAGEYQFNVVVPAVPAGDQAVTADIAGTAAPAQWMLPIGR